MIQLSLKGLAVLVCTAGFFLSACGSGGNGEPTGDERPVDVSLTTVHRGSIETLIQATGTIAPARETFIGPKVGGRIEEFFVDEGAFVDKNEVLLKLEQIRFVLTLNEAKAARQESLAELRNLENKLERNKSLYAKGVVGKEVFDDIQTSVDLARSRAKIVFSRLEQAEEDLKDSILKAPFAGFVVERRMNTGELYAGVAGEYVFHIVDTRTVEVEVNVFETKKQYISAGKKVTVDVDAIPGKRFQGVITVVNPLIDPVSRKFLVKITVPNEGYILEAGMFARVSIPEEQRTNTLLVPARAVVERRGNTCVYTVKDGTARERTVTTGLTTHEYVEILHGLNEGEAVIIDGLYAVKDKTPVSADSP